MKSKRIKTYRESIQMEWREYSDQLNPEEKKFIKEFYEEYYANKGYFKDKEDRILTSKEQVSEANRIHNSLKRDYLLAATNSGELTEAQKKERFLNDVSDENDWTLRYSQGGFELAAREIVEQTLLDLENRKLTRITTLVRFYSKMKSLNKHHNKTKRKSR